MNKENIFKMIVIVISILILGLGVGLLRISSFGTDPFSCMDLGISMILREKLGLNFMTFGVWQIIMNGILLILVFLLKPKTIGFGTVVNMVFVGLSADMWVYGINHIFGNDFSIWMRGIILILGVIAICLAVAVYMACDLGIAPYDAIGVIIEERTKGKITFRWGRIITDCICVAIGFSCASFLGNQWEITGIGTLIMAFGTGPLVQFFRKHVAEKIIKQNQLLTTREGNT